MVLATSNKPWTLDEAMRRRLERRIYIPLPDTDARAAMLTLNTRKLRLAADVDVGGLAAETAGYSGADLHVVCRDAAMMRMRAAVAGKSPQARHATQPPCAAQRPRHPGLFIPVLPHLPRTPAAPSSPRSPPCLPQRPRGPPSFACIPPAYPTPISLLYLAPTPRHPRASRPPPPQEIVKLQESGELEGEVCRGDFAEALQRTTPSVAATDLREYEAWQEEFGSK